MKQYEIIARETVWYHAKVTARNEQEAWEMAQDSENFEPSQKIDWQVDSVRELASPIEKYIYSKLVTIEND